MIELLYYKDVTCQGTLEGLPRVAGGQTSIIAISRIEISISSCCMLTLINLQTVSNHFELSSHILHILSLAILELNVLVVLKIMLAGRGYSRVAAILLCCIFSTLGGRVS